MKRKSGYTTIALKKKTVEKLKLLGKKGETYEEVIQRLLGLEKELLGQTKSEAEKH